MVEREKILESVYRAVDEVNLQLEAESRLKKAEDMIIAGESASLDSLSFLNLVLAAEGAVNDVLHPAHQPRRAIDGGGRHSLDDSGRLRDPDRGLQEG